MGNSLPEPFNKLQNLSRIPRLIHEPSSCTLREQLPRSPFNLFQCAVKGVSKVGRDKRSADVPSQLCTSPSLLRVSVDRCRGNGLLEPVELGFEGLNLFLDIFEFLQAFN